jgi:hypothetical protein
MNTKILKKITNNIRFQENEINGKKEYSIERRLEDEENWDVIGRSTRIERVLVKKHTAWILELHKMHYSGRLLDRRKARARKNKKR